MSNFILKRILLIIPLLLGVTIVCFILVNINQSDPAEVTLRVNNITVTKEAIEETRKDLGLDKPLINQYLSWISNLIKGNFGISYESKKPVLNELSEAFPITLYLSIFSLFLIVFFGFIIGVLCALFENTLFDKIVRGIIFTTTAIPNFWLALLLIYTFAYYYNIFPSNGFEGLNSLVLPSITLAITYISTFVRIIRNSIIQTKNSLFMTYAKARGVSKYTLLKHQIRNAIAPFIVALNMSIPRLLAGTVIIENIFALPGLGRVCVHAIFVRDYPIIQSYVLFMALLFIIFNLIADIWIIKRDPRLRHFN
ncbi:nickel ABC transporter permease subunit NikB [Malaciobacter molluscorum LMG 25693]|uniref:Nickel ABC transporter permease subunit NikB n=1 Tax=Malaciobacter molluscorum LMG 25693 TaxID=870501 RepID=A0A2G1DJ57_9BACT|nr:nickel/cobalt ABC transporter permease [Malaciobacter molluscorum]AXX91668.1 nickel ABC transporter, permease protein [Malaciobacter molluscorum LMG 25693]PHO18538.1 nickel ABC transporter permease subunit NikB [Malaciobacter molluscorum LMG 25693]